jgi:hypothetical protein
MPESKDPDAAMTGQRLQSVLTGACPSLRLLR